MARRIASAFLRTSGLASLVSSSGQGIAAAQRCLPAAASYATSVLAGQQQQQHPRAIWQGSSSSFSTTSQPCASEGESALNYADEFDYISYPPSRAFVGQMAPDFEAPGALICPAVLVSSVDGAGDWCFQPALAVIH